MWKEYFRKADNYFMFECDNYSICYTNGVLRVYDKSNSPLLSFEEENKKRGYLLYKSLVRLMIHYMHSGELVLVCALIRWHNEKERYHV